MKTAKIYFSALEGLTRGVEKLAQAVGTTLGPLGRNVAISKPHEDVVLHDGVSVARAINLPDKLEALGANIVKQAAEKTVSEVGDCTTGTIVLANAIIKETYKRIAAGENPMLLRKELEADAKKAVEFVMGKAQPAEGKLAQVATIAAEDEDLGKLVAEVTQKAGIDGTVAVEESKSNQTFYEHQEGLQIDSGWVSPYFITNPQDMTAVLEGPRILVTNKTVGDFLEMVDFLNKTLIPHTRSLFIVAPEFGGSALPSFIANKMEGKLNVLLVKSPFMEQHQLQFLLDICSLTGAKFLAREAQAKFSDLTIADLGYADKVIATKDATLIIGGKAKGKEERITQIKQALEKETNEFEKLKLKERLAKLTGGVAVIKVGGHTEVEMRERKERVVDAVEAVKAAMRGGIVPGGETTFLFASKHLGDSILGNALKQPFFKLLLNAGLSAEVLQTKLKFGKGVNVITGEIVNMYEAGIVDPALVLVSAINNAVSVAIQICTTEVAIIENEMSSLPRK